MTTRVLMTVFCLSLALSLCVKADLNEALISAWTFDDGSAGDAIGNNDATKFHRCSAGCPDAFLDVFGQVTQVDVAGSNVRPGIHYRDHRLVNLLIIHPGGTEHGAGGCPFRSFFNLVASHD